MKYMYTHVQIHVYTCACTCIHVYIYTYIHVHVHVYTCTYTCMYMYLCKERLVYNIHVIHSCCNMTYKKTLEALTIRSKCNLHVHVFVNVI